MTAAAGKRRGFSVLCIVAALLFAALGAWQVQRLAWKRDLIARVDARLAAPPVAAPRREQWPALDVRGSEYARVEAKGVFAHDRETLVDALTELGPGAWVLTPLRTPDGVILVNRGFVRPDQRDPAQRPEGQVRGEVTIVGLLRATEPRGRIFRANDPAADRWFSRDVAAIARRRDLADVAPFFIDADATPNPGGAPLGGLTVVRFRNAHLVYAVTWFSLSLLCAGGLVIVRRERNPARGSTAPARVS